MQTKLISAAALLLAATLSHAADGKKAAASIPDNTPILMQASKLDGGLPKGDQTILFKDCKVDSAATKKLNK